MITPNGWYERAVRLISPNVDDRPAAEVVSVLVIHNISLPPGQFGGGHVQNFFTNSLDVAEHSYFATIADTRVSAHLLIERSGVITQFASFHQRAWHAGISSFAGRDKCNDFSIGIELEGTDIDPYTDIQYQRLTEVTGALMGYYPAISLERIVGHCEIAPQRKTDPGTSFDWHRYLSALTEKSGV
ncbi:MAG: 1,6-anhydro-N-acetylmuramyl-L-alanine amidase AmpD [Porticoccaceae bacterium]|nr:1,6-anhydro-N-acetylmuramyl-L-alanine amidase AmpD [Porticoccaceae bacterium]